MKTLLFTLEFPPFKGGVANYYGSLAKYWPLGEKLEVLNNNKRELISRKGFLTWWPAYFSLRRKIRVNKIEYILVGHILPLGTVAYINSIFHGTKYSIILHGMDFLYATKGYKKILSYFILNRADKIICANSYLAELVIDYGPKWEEKIHVVNPGIEPGIPNENSYKVQEIRKEYKDKFVLFTLGRLVKRKGIDTTIKALSLLPSEVLDNLVYVVAGKGPDKDYLYNLVPSLLEDKVIFLDLITEQEKWAWLQVCDIFIMPSRKIGGDFEGFGIVYLEANLAKKPVIAGDAGGVKDAVIDKETGLLVNPEDLNDISWAILTLFNNPEMRNKLGENGYRRVIKEFNWEDKAKKIVKIIKE